jgi:hypothetical protein
VRAPSPRLPSGSPLPDPAPNRPEGTRGEGTSTALLEKAVTELLAESLEAWGVDGEVVCEAGEMLILAGAKRLRISRAPADVPFRWMIADGERARGATSVSGLLRSLRAAVDPGHQPVRLRIAPLPLLPP